MYAFLLTLQCLQYACIMIFIDSSKNRPDILLQIAKGSSSVILSRSFVEFVMGSLNLSTLIEMFDSKPYGTDEMLFHSLHSDDSLGKFNTNSIMSSEM